MKKKPTLVERFKADPPGHVFAFVTLIVGLLFILGQGIRLSRPDAAGADMLAQPIGLFDWGFVWADALIPGPLLLIGGLFLLWGRLPLGHLFAFAGWTVNLYNMIVFYAGHRGLGKPLAGAALAEIVVTALVSAMCMLWTVGMVARERPARERPARPRAARR